MDNSFQNSTIAQILEAIIEQSTFEGESNSEIADILLSILNQTPYDKEPCSVIAELLLKLKAKIEGESFDPYDKAYTSRIAEILISILNETDYNDLPQSRIAELLLELKEELEAYTEVTASGAIANFITNVSKPLVSLAAYVKATQESGTPTPQSPKAINGVSSVTVTQADENMQAVVSEVINLGGTYYGGYVSQDKDGKRVLVVTHKAKTKLKDLGYWNYSESGNRFFINNFSDVIQKTDWNRHIGLCECYIEGRVGNNQGDNLAYGFYNKSLYLRDTNYSDVATWLNAVGDNYMVYELAEPFTVALPDGEPIITLNGVNNIYNDSGDTSVTYLYKGEPPLSAPLGFGLGSSNESEDQDNTDNEDIIEEEV